MDAAAALPCLPRTDDMRKPFDETSAGLALTAAIDVIFAGLLWLLCALPVITLGPACTALYYTTVKSVRHERGRIAQTFFSSFKSNFRVSLSAWLILTAYLLIGTANIYLLSGMANAEGTVIWYLSRIMLLPAVFVFVWLFPFISRFENSVAGSLRFSGYLALKNIGKTLLLSAVLAAFAIVGWLLPGLIPLLPGVCCLVMSYVTEGALRAAAEGSEDNNADKWYNE